MFRATRRYATGLALPLEDPKIGRDGIVEGVMVERLRSQELARDQELDAKIAMGWGATDAHKIPADWRTRMGPDSATRRALFQMRGKERRRRRSVIKRPV